MNGYLIHFYGERGPCVDYQQARDAFGAVSLHTSGRRKARNIYQIRRMANSNVREAPLHL